MSETRGQVSVNWLTPGVPDDSFHPDLPVGTDQNSNYGDPPTLPCVAHFDCSRALQDQMVADPQLIVLFSEEVNQQTGESSPIIDKGENPIQAEWGNTNAWLNAQPGMTEALRKAINGNDSNEFLREEIAAHMHAYVMGAGP